MIAVPPWVARVDPLLIEAARDLRLLGAVTPRDADDERARLIRALARRAPAAPRWVYAPVVHGDLRRRLDAAERTITSWSSHDAQADPLDGQGASAIEHCYLARVRELALEADIAEAVGTPRLAKLAALRFAEDDSVAVEAEALSLAWLEEEPDDDESDNQSETGRDGEHADATVESDSNDPRSLLSRMRAEVFRRRIPFSVAPHRALASLAATGDSSILVATSRALSDEDTRRTVLHEIEGHALPRVRAKSALLGVFVFGTARGADDQEGRALSLEERAGLLGRKRRRQLAARHLTTLRMRAGATFTDAARALVREHGLSPADAVVVTERAYRGGDGVFGGLGRERVYLEAWLRVRRWLDAHPEDEAVLMAGQVAVDAIPALRAYVSRDGAAAGVTC